jgi:hypothetical protein
MMVNEYLNQFI